MPTRAPSVFAVPGPDDQARPPFTLEHTKDAYTKQYANLYWLRLVVLRPRAEKRAKAAWAVKTNKHVKGELQSLRSISTTAQRGEVVGCGG
jgi:hypothetical protein